MKKKTEEMKEEKESVSVPADLLEHRQWNAKAQLGRHVGQRVTGGLAGQGGAPGEAGVHLDDVILRQSDKETSGR